MEIRKNSILDISTGSNYKEYQWFPIIKYIKYTTENTDFLYLHDEKELELHIWRI